MKCKICNDYFKESTVAKKYTLVTCKSCKKSFCLKHSSSRETSHFLNAILKDLSRLDGVPDGEARIHRRQAFNSVKDRIWFDTEVNGQLLSSKKRLTPIEMASWLKEIDSVIAQRVPSVRENYPATLCPFCTLEYIDTDTLLAYCMLELKKYYSHLTIDELVQHLIHEFKQRYQTLEAFETNFKGEIN